MKIIPLDGDANLPSKTYQETDTFAFKCHGSLSCFNRCCRNLNLYLYPYDVLRLKRHLKLSSDEFLDRHVDVVLRPGAHFPEVLLSMNEDAEKTCPFLGAEGCRVYPDRPDACRTFPMEQGVMLDPQTGRSRYLYFFRPPEFCLGQHEDKLWSPLTWMDDQEARVYQEMTTHWAKIRQMFHKDPFNGQGPACQKGKMAFMAAYNTDRFRDFIFHSSFLKRYKVKSPQLKKIKTSDTALLLFGFKWMRHILWNIPTKSFHPR